MPDGNNMASIKRLCLVLLTFVLVAATSGSRDGWEIPVEYSVDGSDYTSLGSITLTKQLDGNYTGQFSVHSPSTSAELFASLKKAVSRHVSRTTPAPVYRVRSADVMSSNYPCLFILSRMHHTFAVALDDGSQPPKLLSLTVLPGRNAPGTNSIDMARIGELCDDSKQAKIQSSTLKAEVLVSRDGELPSPDTATYLQRIEDEKRARQHGAQQDNRSFLAKYWMYIVPVVIFMVLSNAFTGDQGGGGGGE